MSYAKYLKLYARNVNNYGRFAKRGRKNNYWIRSLKISDKVDVFDGQDRRWHVTTILKIEHKDNLTKIYIYYDGWGDSFNEWININHSQVTSTKIKRLHTFTPYHHYLLDPSQPPCTWRTGSRCQKCSICSRNCCKTCFISEQPKGSGNFQCKLCMDTIEYQHLFDPIYAALYNQYDIDINIIYLITDYSKGIIVSCSNIVDHCHNEIYFESNFDIDADLRNNEAGRQYKEYQYVPNYIHDAGTLMVNGKYRRIFCSTCYETRLTRCALCYQPEIRDKTLDRNRTICHKHDYKKCGCCDRSFDACAMYWARGIVDCGEGHKQHCRRCICGSCHACIGIDDWFLCKDCKTTICKKCQKYKTLEICNQCLPKSCDECGEFFYDKMVYKCNRCDRNICIDCKKFYGFKGGKILKKCNICDNKDQKRERLRSNNNGGTQMNVIVKEDFDIDCDELEFFSDDINIIIVDSKYDKKKRCKNKEMDKRKKRSNCLYHKRKHDKMSNIKQRRRFNQRYALSLQY